MSTVRWLDAHCASGLAAHCAVVVGAHRHFRGAVAPQITKMLFVTTDKAVFPFFTTSEDHEELRAAVRAVAEDKIAPHAAEADETATFPQAGYDALVASDFHAPHIGQEYGGVGADALATCIVIEEVARVCASSSLIPAVNKLGK